MRGSPNKFKIFYPVLRIIPTGAGLTDAPQLDTKAFGDHPRGCGARQSYAKQSYPELGSSPRMRGSRRHTIYQDVIRGIIPAHAGLTLRQQARYHLQGAHTTVDSTTVKLQGSSPRMRGSQPVSSDCLSCSGIIPAGAGLTPARYSRFSDIRDHPRGCGAHAESRAVKPVKSGSSPRVRGSHFMRDLPAEQAGIIPAGAGLTHCYRHVHCRIRDHPRGCGAHAESRAVKPVKSGSSPRVRGSHFMRDLPAEQAGIIPAGAGLTRAQMSPACFSGDHPRGCGAHVPRQLWPLLLLGSSPRVRGSLYPCLRGCS